MRSEIKASLSVLVFIGLFTNLLNDLRGNETPILDYRWAGHFQRMIDAIESQDLNSFQSLRDGLAKDQKNLTAAQIYERDLLIWFLTRHAVSPKTSISEMSAKWSAGGDRDWGWETLLAMIDILGRFEKSESVFQRSVRNKLTVRFSSFNELHDRAIITNPELARYATQYVRRLNSDGMAFAECERLLAKLPNDFPLLSIATDRLSSLFKEAPDLWQQTYNAYLSRAAEMLKHDEELRVRYPVALPKVLFEHARLKLADEARFGKLSEALDACESALAHLRLIAASGAEAVDARTLVLARLKANVLLHGYRLAREISEEHQDANRMLPSSCEIFSEPIPVASALRDILAQSGALEPSELVNVQLSLADILLDSVQKCPDPQSAESARLENEFLGIVDQSNGKIDSLQTSSVSRIQLRRLSQVLELSWAEWSIQRSVSLTPQREEAYAAGRPNSSHLSKVLTRLESLKSRIGDTDDSLSVRINTDIGYIYLKRGDYKNVIDFFDAGKLGSQFSANVILCLAFKDSGQIEMANQVLEDLDRLVASVGSRHEKDGRSSIGDNTEPTHKRLIYFLKSELSIETHQIDYESIKTLRNLLNEQLETAFRSPREYALRHSNEHHQAIALKELASEEIVDFLGLSSNQSALDLSRKIWTKHLDGDYPEFVKARAAYSLAEINIAAGSEQIKALQRDLVNMTEDYRQELKRFNATDRTDANAFKNLEDKREAIRIKEEGFRLLISDQLKDGVVRSRVLDAVKYLPSEETYPNLRYSILCLALRVYLLSPDDAFKENLKNSKPVEWPLDKIASTVCEIAIQQRVKISNNGILGDERNVLFERYRDGFDLAINLAVADERFKDAAQIAAATSNLSVCDLWGQFDSNQTQDYSVESIRLPTDPFVSFFVGNTTTHVFWRFTKDGDKISHHQIRIDRPVLSAAISQYVERYLTPSKNPSADAFEKALALANRLFNDKFLTDLSKLQGSTPQRVVYVIPHGPFFRVPLDTLPLGGTAEEGVFLESKCPPLVYLPTLSASKRARTCEQQENQPFLLTIQPGSDVGSESDLLYKNFAEEGVTWLTPEKQKLCSNSAPSSFLATPESVLDVLQSGYRFVHFGCHGKSMEGDRSLIGGANLMLWNDNLLNVVALLDRFSLQSGQCLRSELVLLSACETQMTDDNSLRYGGNTVKALGTAFLVAGAENVIASHWKINDPSTKDFVVKFMNQLKESAKRELSVEDYALILHRTRKMIAAQEGFKNPCDWGPFTLSTILSERD